MKPGILLKRANSNSGHGTRLMTTRTNYGTSPLIPKNNRNNSPSSLLLQHNLLGHQQPSSSSSYHTNPFKHNKSNVESIEENSCCIQCSRQSLTAATSTPEHSRQSAVNNQVASKSPAAVVGFTMGKPSSTVSTAGSTTTGTDSGANKPKDGFRSLDENFWSQLEENTQETEVQIAPNIWRGRILISASVFQLFIGILVAGVGLFACVLQTAPFCPPDIKAQMYLSLTAGLSIFVTGTMGLISACEVIDVNCAVIGYCVSSMLTLIGICLLMAIDGWNFWMYYQKFDEKYGSKGSKGKNNSSTTTMMMKGIWEEFNLTEPWSRQLAYQIAVSLLAVISVLICLISLCYFCCRRQKRPNWWDAVGSLEASNPKRRRQNRRDRKTRHLDTGSKGLLHEE